MKVISGLNVSVNKAVRSADQPENYFVKTLRLLLLAALMGGLLVALPLSSARAADNELPPLTYEVREPIVPGSLALAPFTMPPPQWRSIEQMTKSERRAMLVQVAADAVIHNSTLHALRDIWLSVREPIRTEDGNLSCKTRLSPKTYFMRCTLKF